MENRMYDIYLKQARDSEIEKVLDQSSLYTAITQLPLSIYQMQDHAYVPTLVPQNQFISRTQQRGERLNNMLRNALAYKF